MARPEACRSTQHCAYHGWCNRCDPEFAAVMSRVNSVIQHTDPTDSHWGPLYAALAVELRKDPTTGLPPTQLCTDPHHTGAIREQFGCNGPDPVADQPSEGLHEQYMAAWWTGAVDDDRDSIDVETAATAAMRVVADELEVLRNDSRVLNALRAAGVDNWEGYELAMENLDS